ncbi:MAG: NAD-dependent malic enzyme [Acidobacteriota bacterium]
MPTAVPSAQYAITIRLEYPHGPGWIARVAGAIGKAGGVIRAIDLVHIRKGRSLRDYTVECSSSEHATSIAQAVRRLGGVHVHSVSDETFLMHLGGKLEIASKVSLKTRADMSMAYTPGVARVCEAIHRDWAVSFNLTIRKNCVAVVSDGSAVLGLGNIGAAAALPVMEGKAILFKEFGGVDAFPLCIETQEPEAIIAFCKQIAPSFGGINLEDIAAPKCLRIERELRQALEIPVFHDDQHGTAVVVLAGVINALKVTRKRREKMKVVVSGAGAAGSACTRILADFGMAEIIVCDRQGAIYAGRQGTGNPVKEWIAAHTNPARVRGSLREVLAGADMFLGVSGPNLLGRADIETMGRDPIVFAMSNPDPEVPPEEIDDVVAVMATGRSDYPNQVNNVLAFPGIFRGTLDARAGEINEEMKQAAAHAIAGIIPDDHLMADYIIPGVFNRQVAKRVARAVRRAAQASGVARRQHKSGGLDDLEGPAGREEL